MRIITLCCGAALLLSMAAAPPAAAQPEPRGTAGDGASIDSILAALYGVISGPAGQVRDWDRFHALFYPGARLIPSGQRPDGSKAAAVLEPAGYVERSREILESRGFFETEVARRVERYGGIAHVWSTYESRFKADDPQPFMRGINSIQLFWDGSRWWVLTVAW
ncbi:MAG TPA: hypothetical protein VNP72_02555, partial [Longimicrobium sp.]|nr:hypothetical protein [Longimicrobium sp.]